MTYSRRSLAYIAVFGSVWGVAEATFGNMIHLLHLPLSGALLSAMSLVFMLTARRLNPVSGSTFLMALIAASIKMLSFTAVKIGPFAGIVIEGLIADIILSVLGNRKSSWLLTGFIVGIYPIIQNLVTKSLLFGLDFINVIFEMAEGFSEKVGFQLGWWLIIFYIGVHVALGLGSSIFTWKLQNQIEQKLNKKKTTTF